MKNTVRELRAALLGAAVLACVAAAPAQAQDDNAAALAQIDASLPGNLINDPTSLEWRLQGERVRPTPLADPAIPGGGAATKYDIRRAGANPWDVAAYVPLRTDVTSGQTITYGFWARSNSSNAADGNGKIGARIQLDGPPYSGFADQTFSVGSEWEWFEMTGTANVTIPQRTAYLVFQLAGAQQSVEIGQTFVIEGAARILPPAAARPAAPLPASLEGRGTLISQPTPTDFALIANSGSYVAREEGGIFTGRAVQFTSPAASAQPWDLQAAVPLTETIAAGDQIEIAIAARTISAATEDGKGRVSLRIQGNTAPYDAIYEANFAVGPNWQLVRVRTTASADMAAGSGVVALHFAGAQQVVDLGPVYVLRLPPAQP